MIDCGLSLWSIANKKKKKKHKHSNTHTQINIKKKKIKENEGRKSFSRQNDRQSIVSAFYQLHSCLECCILCWRLPMPTLGPPQKPEPDSGDDVFQGGPRIVTMSKENIRMWLFHSPGNSITIFQRPIALTSYSYHRPTRVLPVACLYSSTTVHSQLNYILPEVVS